VYPLLQIDVYKGKKGGILPRYLPIKNATENRTNHRNTKQVTEAEVGMLWNVLVF
jgi:hypothetical protein